MEPESSLLHLQSPVCSSYPEPDHSLSMPPHLISWSILISSSHLLLGLQNTSPSSLPTKTLYAPPLSPTRVPSAPPVKFFLIWLVRSIDHKAPLYAFFSSPLSLAPLKPRYLSQHPILKHPQPTRIFIPNCEGPSFTPAHNNGQNYSSVYLNIYIFWTETCEFTINRRDWRSGNLLILCSVTSSTCLGSRCTDDHSAWRCLCSKWMNG